jgi:hypothetical protein
MYMYTSRPLLITRRVGLGTRYEEWDTVGRAQVAQDKKCSDHKTLQSHFQNPQYSFRLENWTRLSSHSRYNHIAGACQWFTRQMHTKFADSVDSMSQYRFWKILGGAVLHTYGSEYIAIGTKQTKLILGGNSITGNTAPFSWTWRWHDRRRGSWFNRWPFSRTSRWHFSRLFSRRLCWPFSWSPIRGLGRLACALVWSWIYGLVWLFASQLAL